MRTPTIAETKQYLDYLDKKAFVDVIKDFLKLNKWDKFIAESSTQINKITEFTSVCVETDADGDDEGGTTFYITSLSLEYPGDFVLDLNYGNADDLLDDLYDFKDLKRSMYYNDSKILAVTEEPFELRIIE